MNAMELESIPRPLTQEVNIEQSSVVLEIPRDNVSHHDNRSLDRGREQLLAPADHGRRAWILLIVASLFEALFWGTFSVHRS